MNLHISTNRSVLCILSLLMVAVLIASSLPAVMAQSSNQSLTIQLIPAGIDGQISGSIVLKLPSGYELTGTDVNETTWSGDIVSWTDYEYTGRNILDTQTAPDGSQYSSFGEQYNGIDVGGGVIYVRGIPDIRDEAQQHSRPYIDDAIYEEGYFSVSGDGSTYSGYYYLSKHTETNMSTYEQDGEEVTYEWDCTHHNLQARLSLSQTQPMYTVAFWASTWGLPDRVDEQGWTHTYTIDGKPQLAQHEKFLKDLFSNMQIMDWVAPSAPSVPAITPTSTPAATAAPTATPAVTPFTDDIEEVLQSFDTTNEDLTSISLDSISELAMDEVSKLEESMQSLESYEQFTEPPEGKEYLGKVLHETDIQGSLIKIQKFQQDWQISSKVSQNLGVMTSDVQRAVMNQASGLYDDVTAEYTPPSEPNIIRVQLQSPCSMLEAEIDRLEREYDEALAQKEKYLPKYKNVLKRLQEDAHKLSTAMTNYADTEIREHLAEAIDLQKGIVLSMILSPVTSKIDDLIGLTGKTAVTAINIAGDLKEGDTTAAVLEFFGYAKYVLDKANVARYKSLDLKQIGGPLGAAGYIQNFIDVGMVLAKLTIDSKMLYSHERYLHTLNILMNNTQAVMGRLTDAPQDIMSQLSSRRAEYDRKNCQQAEVPMLDIVVPEFELYTGEIELYTGEVQLYCGENSFSYESVDLEYLNVDLEYLPVDIEYLPVHFVN